MSPVDVRAEHWRQEQEIAAAARALEALDRQAQRDQEARARRKRRQQGMTIRGYQPAWQRWLIVLIGLPILWQCVVAVLFDGKNPLLWLLWY